MGHSLCAFLFYGLARYSSKRESVILYKQIHLPEEIRHEHGHSKGSDNGETGLT